MDHFADFEDVADYDSDCLIIPEPLPHADLRPNPTPLKLEAFELPKSELLNEPEYVDTTDAPKSPEIIIDAVAAMHAVKPAVIAHESQSLLEPEMQDTFTSVDDSHSEGAKCFAFMGAGGGTGVTSLCIQLAYDLARRTRKSSSFGSAQDPKVCLIDLDFETGSCASYLDVPNALSIEDLCGPASQIDSSVVQALMSQHESGIAVLSTPNALGANSLANPEAVLSLLDAAAQVYDYVVLDLPRMWQPWIGAAISGADHFAVVSELTIPSLHTARSRILNIEKVLGEDLNCEVVLNKVERRSFRNSIRLSDAEKALNRKISGSICVDVDTTREAINCGEPVEVIRGEARYVKDVRELSLKWVQPKVKKGGFFKERRKKRRAA